MTLAILVSCAPQASNGTSLIALVLGRSFISFAAMSCMRLARRFRFKPRKMNSSPTRTTKLTAI